jgi:hypothetical protein
MAYRMNCSWCSETTCTAPAHPATAPTIPPTSNSSTSSRHPDRRPAGGRTEEDPTLSWDRESAIGGSGRVRVPAVVEWAGSMTTPAWMPNKLLVACNNLHTRSASTVAATASAACSNPRDCKPRRRLRLVRRVGGVLAPGRAFGTSGASSSPCGNALMRAWARLAAPSFSYNSFVCVFAVDSLTYDCFQNPARSSRRPAAAAPGSRGDSCGLAGAGLRFMASARSAVVEA